MDLAIGETEPLLYIERDVETAGILAARIKDGCLRPAHIWSDLTTFDASILRGKVDLAYGGLPCQPFSVAGQQKGDQDERYIWPQFLRILEECEPAVVFLENVPTLVTGGWFRAIGDGLSGMGYQIEDPLFVSASELGLPHKRLRVFVLAYRPGRGLAMLRESSERARFTGGGASKAWKSPGAGSPNSLRGSGRDPAERQRGGIR